MSRDNLPACIAVLLVGDEWPEELIERLGTRLSRRKVNEETVGQLLVWRCHINTYANKSLLPWYLHWTICRLHSMRKCARIAKWGSDSRLGVTSTDLTATAAPASAGGASQCGGPQNSWAEENLFIIFGVDSVKRAFPHTWQTQQTFWIFV